jgi:hypothetical protein
MSAAGSARARVNTRYQNNADEAKAINTIGATNSVASVKIGLRSLFRHVASVAGGLRPWCTKAHSSQTCAARGLGQRTSESKLVS